MSDNRPVIQRLLDHIEIGETGCWLWRGSPDRYVNFTVGGRDVVGHRWSYEYFVGPIPDGLVLDHVYERGCRHRHCVNPDHLEAVTQAENVRRGRDTRQALLRARTHCEHGHPFDERNTYWKPRPTGPVRSCRTCHRDRERAARQRDAA